MPPCVGNSGAFAAATMLPKLTFMRLVECARGSVVRFDCARPAVPDSAWMRAASCDARANKDILAPPGRFAGFESRAFLIADRSDWRGALDDALALLLTPGVAACIAERERPDEKRPAVVFGTLSVPVDCVRVSRLLLLLNKLKVCMFASKIVVPR